MGLSAPRTSWTGRPIAKAFGSKTAIGSIPKNTHIRIFIRNGHCYFSSFAVYRAAYKSQRLIFAEAAGNTPMFIAPKEIS